ncbi:MAG: CoA transferase [Acidobacteria bacterium]|nr:CoA transferase [Acidobacteriota bacterium]
MKPLDGITILDLSRVLAGPYCTMMLADQGARVIKIEHPKAGDDTRGWGPPFLNGESAYFLSINSNKESLTLDFKQPEGRRLLDQLIAKADVVVENFRPGTLEKQGLGYQTLSALHPRLIFCSVSGFGQTGPRSREAGYDAVMQAEGGLMSVTGAADGPPYRLGVPIADVTSGMFAASGVLLALYQREKTGRGQLVDVAMLDSVMSLLTYQGGIYFATGQAPQRRGNRHPTIVPYEVFSASDGDFVVAAGNDELFRKFCEVAGLQSLATHERFSRNKGRVEGYDEIRPIIQEQLRTKTWKEWIDALKAAGVPCGGVRDLREVFDDPQVGPREMVDTIDHPKAGRIRVVNTPIKLSASTRRARTAPPTLGQHTDAVLSKDLGLTRDQIAALRAAGVV